jgi:predicted RNA-binding Zn ribbon-like protein
LPVSDNLKQIALHPEIELLVGFVNTIDIEDDEDALRDPGDAAAWLAAHGDGHGVAPASVGKHPLPLDTAAHADLIAFREGLRALLRANNGGDAGDARIAPLRVAATRSRYGVELEDDGRLALAPLGEGDAARFEARLLLAIQRIQDGGDWLRLKACPAEICQWAFFDSSRNHSRTWCKMGICGNRAKTRRYRARGHHDH